jgi:tetratricopeptide (TPR) repeat protein
MPQSPNRSEVPRLREGIDLTKLKLSVEEGYIASRIDGHLSIGDIANIIGKPKPETEMILQKLARAGIIQFGDVEARSVPPRPTSDGEGEEFDYGKFIFPPALMGENVDLNDDEKKRIIFFHQNLDLWTFYEILRVKRKDDEKAIKRAYFQRSKEWHPDRFVRGKLGSFKRMIDDIYKQIKTAHEVLSDEDARETYDETVIFTPDEDEISEMLDQQRRAERDKLREKERLERRKKRNPVRVRLERAKEMIAEAEAKEKAGDLLGALRAAQTAMAFDEKPEYMQVVERLKVTTGEQRIGPYLRRGMHEETMARFDEAVETFQEAVRIAPENGAVRLRLAYNIISSGKDPQEANKHAHKAVELLPDDPEAHFVLGLCYEKGGMDKAAVRAYERALELRPAYVEAKKRLKKLKWGFFGGG